MLGQRRRLLRDPLNLLDVLEAGVVSVEPPTQQLGVADNRRQRVIEVVSDAAGKLSHAFQSLRLSELVLEATLFGDVFDHRHGVE